ncbi:MAG TPA: DUF5666 domain-containing protein [Anaerolineae bacterium]|nr:DUF5666 domain-containing protein [Anaerolineae bacterium]
MKKPLIIAAAVVGVLLVAAGSFWGGMSYGQSRATQTRARFPEGELERRGAAFPRAGQTPQPGQVGAQRLAGGLRGTIEEVGDDALVITTEEDTIQVQITDTTLINKFAVVTIADLEAGEQVVVSGTRNEDGSYTARSIQVTPAGGPQ